ncbi:hypothetical protein HED49_03060 [Ochrobactrum daejeonense]|nr:hypothetical protein [Brucella daejeonensis]
MTAPNLTEHVVDAVYDHLCRINGEWQPIGPNDIKEVITAALPFLPVQGAVKADAIKLIERMAFGYEVMFEKLCHISGTSGADQSWYRAKAREATERLSPLHSITTESNKSVPGDCKRQYQDFMARILSALEPSAGRAAVLEEGYRQGIEAAAKLIECGCKALPHGKGECQFPETARWKMPPPSAPYPPRTMPTPFTRRRGTCWPVSVTM